MKKYLDLYNYYKNIIISSQMKKGEKMPSIRKCAELHGVSKTTVLNAYLSLAADGYIIAREKSGYYVQASGNTKSRSSPKKRDEIKYNLKDWRADRESFDFNIWRRYIKSALRENERLLSPGEYQGEYELREALSSYIREKRNVIASPDRIIIGAGVQTLLNILCSLLKEKKSVSVPDSKSFLPAKTVFEDHGFEVFTRYKDADIIYVSPSHMTRWGDVMPVRRRLELVNHCKENKSLIIEDDYESDLLYNKKPTPSLHALSGGENVIYMGSFSKILLPSIRISYMVLTEELAELYKSKMNCFMQSAGKTEQIALAMFIRDGHLNSQIRKIRRLYTAKTSAFAEELKNIPGAKVEIGENGLQIKLTAEFPYDEKELERRCRELGISLFTESLKNGVLNIVISSSNISSSEQKQAAMAVRELLR